MASTLLDPPTPASAPTRDRKATHFVLYDAPGRQLTQALCGALTRVKDHANQPSCPDCQRLLREHEAREL